MHWAVGGGYVEVVKALLAAGVDQEAQNEDGRRPLHCAAANGFITVVKALLASGASKQCRTMKDWNFPNMTPYEIAQKKFETASSQDSKDAFKSIMELLRE